MSKKHYYTELPSFLQESSSFKMKVKRNINGILGTIAFHLILAILFVSLKLNHQEVHKEKEVIVVDFVEEDIRVAEQIQETKEKKDEAIDKIAEKELSEEMKDVPVNVSQQEEADLEPDRYLDKYKKDLGVEDPQESVPGDGDISMGDVKAEEQEKQSSDEDAGEYQGPTTVHYHLEGRSKRYLPVPVYMCPNSGKVVVNIRVNKRGQVIYTSINEEKTDVSDECLFEVALRYAERSVFTADLNGPSKQYGYISYQFQSQGSE